MLEKSGKGNTMKRGDKGGGMSLPGGNRNRTEEKSRKTGDIHPGRTGNEILLATGKGSGDEKAI